jgi:DNA replication protein DnaC
MVFWTLVGPTGRGKTVAGGWLIAHIGGAYVCAEDACKLFRAPAHSRAAATWEQLMLKRVLVLDDLGTEREAEDGVAMLNNVVNRRQGLSTGWTLMTANLTKAEYLARYDERAIRRIEHQGAIVVVKGEDLRRKAT